MKLKVLFASVLTGLFAVAQIPTSNLIKDYKFTNGNTTSDANISLQTGTSNLSANGSNRTIITDRNNENNKAISLNGDWFIAGGTAGVPVMNFAISLWIKTSTNDINKRYILDQFVQTNPCGWSVALKDGKVYFNSQSNLNVNSTYTIGGTSEIASGVISDGQWHHVVCQVKTTVSSYFDGTFVHNNGVIRSEMYMDNSFVGFDEKILNGAYTSGQTLTRRAINSTQELYIGKSTNSSNTYTFTEGIDQIRYYEMNLTAQNVTALFMEDKPLIKMYVNSSATGANNGTSWTDAYTSLDAALTAYTTEKQIWVAAGTYKPNGTLRTATFSIPTYCKLYGGFNGTETEINQRNPKINNTILSGDLNGNDNANINSTETTRQDNCYHVISITGNKKEIIIDGFIITGGNANGSTLTSGTASAQYFHSRGGAIYAFTYTANDEIKALINDCILEKNSGSSISVYSNYFAGGVNYQTANVSFNKCIVRDNHTSGLASMLYSGANGYNFFSKGVISNSLFYNNVNSGTSTVGSCIYFAASTNNGGNQLGLDATIVNCTFINNSHVTGNVIIGDNADNLKIHNSIIYNNGSTTPFYLTNGYPIYANNTINGTQLAGSDNSDPLLDSNYRLTSGSTAINSGNNSILPVEYNTDLAGNARIVNSVIDRGAYEFDSNLNTDNFSKFNEFNIYPNPANEFIKIQSNQTIKSVAIYNLLGKLIIKSNNTEINTNYLPSGIYIIEVENENLEKGIKKLIKN